jgi:segregation and condensation protein A
MNGGFKVRVGQFEGPLDLLLDLVEKRRLHISDVTLSQVADNFINYVKSFDEFPMKDSADFILVASTLLLIKSKSLLPGLSLTEEEQESIEELERRLESYKTYKEAAQVLSKIFGKFLYFPKEKRWQKSVFYPTSEITTSNLKNAILSAIESMPKKAEPLSKIGVRKIISLEEMIERLREKIESSLKMSFREFSMMNKAERIDVIVSFLAMLELVKRGLVRAEQHSHFEDINIELERTGVPTYN